MLRSSFTYVADILSDILSISIYFPVTKLYTKGSKLYDIHGIFVDNGSWKQLSIFRARISFFLWYRLIGR